MARRSFRNQWNQFCTSLLYQSSLLHESVGFDLVGESRRQKVDYLPRSPWLNPDTPKPFPDIFRMVTTLAHREVIKGQDLARPTTQVDSPGVEQEPVRVSWQDY